MIFARVALDQARGGILAHNLKTADRVLRKGAMIDDAAFELLHVAGHAEVTVARLEPGDTPEGIAAAQLGERLLSEGIRRSEDVHGRVNLFATQSGLLRLEPQAVRRLNGVDESITLATLADYSVVAAGDMIATLKIIPFAVAAPAMQEAEQIIGETQPIQVKPFRALKVGLALSKLPQLKPAAIAQTVKATQARIEAHGGLLLPPIETAHETGAIARAIEELLAQGAQLVLVSGASAVTDRRDVAPAAIVQAGGKVSHFGMPVDPGNLICFGALSDVPAIILPGCARSPKLNGIDWVLDRVFAGEAVDRAAISAMGVGGLLKEFPARPAPRDSARAVDFGKTPRAIPRIAAIVLAAGRSSRMGNTNKLLARMPDGRRMIEQTVDQIAASPASPILVVTGHQETEIRATLAGRPVRFVSCPDYAEGMAASLRSGVSALAAEIGAALICLGDMPLVDAPTLSRLLTAYDPAEGREIVIPSFDGQRGNPVLWGRRFFPELMSLTGDTGGRQILHRYMEFVSEVLVDNDTVLRDFDTPELLAALAK
ncbi:MAG: 4-diphosphocytidyl-2C-methyl-D-erythritol kinase [Rhodospirillales bacterium 20-64-7]|nr:MAG: 4-diphosphocytidyl-2C-methyl-D-erythritol kinase [Rhodospirillales bacterium 20-64-7]